MSQSNITIRLELFHILFCSIFGLYQLLRGITWFFSCTMVHHVHQLVSKLCHLDWTCSVQGFFNCLPQLEMILMENSESEPKQHFFFLLAKTEWRLGDAKRLHGA